jgi:phospholipid-transporting ATPase
MLFSSSKNGVAYVETKNLDGETNLKYKESVKNSYKLVKNFDLELERDKVIKKTFGKIDCASPNALMYEFDGVFFHDNRISVCKMDLSGRSITEENELNKTQEMKNQNLSGEESKSNLKRILSSESLSPVKIMESLNFSKRISKLLEDESNSQENINTAVNLEYNNFLLRGSSLRNTDYIYGVVVYAGHNTKIMLNSLSARSKQSKVFKIMNSQLKLIILIQMLLCLCFALFFSIDTDPYIKLFDENSIAENQIESFIFVFFSWLLTLSNIVPISLLVTIEMIKFCQAIFISWDFKLYDSENRRPAIVQSSSLNEELGQVMVKV